MQLLQVQDKQEPVTKGLADDCQLIDDDIISVEPAPIELKWDMTDKEFEEYKKIALDKLRSNNEFREEYLRRFLKRNNILVYSLKDVIRFLKYKTREPRSLCFIFLVESSANAWICKSRTESQFGGLPVHETIYSSFVPLRVVKRINLVLDEFPKLGCLVCSCYKNSYSEVFVAVTFGNTSEVFVIDMWGKGESVLAKEGK